MNKFMLLAAMLAMVLVSAVPAFAQTTVDNSDLEIDSEFNDNNIAANFSDQYNNQSVVNGNGNVQINEQEQDNEAFAGDVFYDSDFDGVDDEEENEDEFSFNDSDFDGVDDDFDFFVFFGDFDNDGINDQFENGGFTVAGL